MVQFEAKSLKNWWKGRTSYRFGGGLRHFKISAFINNIYWLCLPKVPGELHSLIGQYNYCTHDQIIIKVWIEIFMRQNTSSNIVKSDTKSIIIIIYVYIIIKYWKCQRDKILRTLRKDFATTRPHRIETQCQAIILFSKCVFWEDALKKDITDSAGSRFCIYHKLYRHRCFNAF